MTYTIICVQQLHRDIAIVECMWRSQGLEQATMGHVGSHGKWLPLHRWQSMYLCSCIRKLCPAGRHSLLQPQPPHQRRIPVLNLLNLEHKVVAKANMDTAAPRHWQEMLVDAEPAVCADHAVQVRYKGRKVSRATSHGGDVDGRVMVLDPIHLLGIPGPPASQLALRFETNQHDPEKLAPYSAWWSAGSVRRGRVGQRTRKPDSSRAYGSRTIMKRGATSAGCRSRPSAASGLIGGHTTRP